MCQMFHTEYKWLEIEFDITQLLSKFVDIQLISEEEAKMTVAELKNQIKTDLQHKNKGRLQIQLHETIQIFVTVYMFLYFENE